MISKGFLLHKYASGETSNRVIFFTEEQGLVNTQFKGARRSKKNVLLQAFTPLWLHFNNEQAMFLTNLEPTSANFHLQGKSLFAALYLNELLYYCLKPFDPYPELFQNYNYALQALSLNLELAALEAVLRRFEWNLLNACGYHLNNLPIELGNHYSFVIDQGFIKSLNGISGIYAEKISQGNFSDVAVLKIAKPLFRQAIDRLLNGRILKSRSLFKATLKT